MLRITVVLAALLFATASFAESPPLAIFGIVFLAPPSMPECATEMTYSGLSKQKFKSYVMTDPKGGPCFERNREFIDTSTPMADETIAIKFSLGTRPELSKYPQVSARVVNGNIERLWFWTNGISSQNTDIAALKQKFGAPQTESSTPVQTRAGATFASISTMWQLPDGITVSYLSADGSIDRGIVVVQTVRGEEAYRRALEAIGGSKTKL